MMNTMEKVKNNARSCNIYLTEEVMQSMDIITILNNCHPSDRARYAKELKEEGLITEDQAKNYVEWKGGGIK